MSWGTSWPDGGSDQILAVDQPWGELGYVELSTGRDRDIGVKYRLRYRNVA